MYIFDNKCNYICVIIAIKNVIIFTMNIASAFTFRIVIFLYLYGMYNTFSYDEYICIHHYILTLFGITLLDL